MAAARRAGVAVPDAALAASFAWLRQAKRWDEGAKRAGSSDLKLARLQFAVAALEVLDERQPRLAAASVLLADQSPGGEWAVDTGDAPGSPITWGTSLATALALRNLRALNWRDAEPACRRAEDWIRRRTPSSTVDAAAQLLALPEDVSVRRAPLAFLLSSQTREGGWGPRRGTPAEAFDTAIALIALDQLPPAVRPRANIGKGRAFLAAQRAGTGGWPETTRPSGQQSYAHHVSTTAWAVLALLSGDQER